QMPSPQPEPFRQAIAALQSGPPPPTMQSTQAWVFVPWAVHALNSSQHATPRQAFWTASNSPRSSTNPTPLSQMRSHADSSDPSPQPPAPPQKGPASMHVPSPQARVPGAQSKHPKSSAHALASSHSEPPPAWKQATQAAAFAPSLEQALNAAQQLSARHAAT